MHRWVYASRGQVETVTQYDHATAGSGSILDEVKYTYDDWGNVTLFEQDKDSAVGGNQYSVAYTYANPNTGGNGRHAVRCTGMTLPSGVSLTYEYLGASSAKIDDQLSRVSRIKHGSTIVATYKYTGLGMLVETALNQPNVTTLTHGASMGDYPYLDNFNRVIDSRWQAGNASNTPFYRVALTYDRNSNITTAEDHVHTVGTAGSGNGLFDAVYTMDNLDRVTEAREGHLSGGAIANNGDTKRDQQWTLDQVGNWKNEKLDISGGAVNWTGAGEYQQDGTFNVANEWTKREQDTNATPGYENTYTMTYDGVGNMTSDGQNYKYVYDAFNRLVEVKTQGNATVTKYRYNGLGHRIMWQYDNDGVAGFNPANDKKFYFVYDTKWRMVATYRESDADPKEEFTNHNAGLDGSGSSSYIDAVVMRDKDANTAWATASADGVLEERRIYCQNWRGDVSAIVTDTGKMVEWIKYSAYGVSFGIPAGDTNSKGSYIPADNAFMATGQTYDIRRDVNMDGTVTGADATHAASITGGFQTLGRGVLSSTSVGNRKGYAGYENDGSIGDQYHVRYRVYRPTLGRWTQRDPVGYRDGMDLYEYVRSMPITEEDPTGLAMNIGPGYGTPCNPGNGGGGVVVPMGVCGGGGGLGTSPGTPLALGPAICRKKADQDLENHFCATPSCCSKAQSELYTCCDKYWNKPAQLKACNNKAWSNLTTCNQDYYDWGKDCYFQCIADSPALCAADILNNPLVGLCLNLPPGVLATCWATCKYTGAGMLPCLADCMGVTLIMLTGCLIGYDACLYTMQYVYCPAWCGYNPYKD